MAVMWSRRGSGALGALLLVVACAPLPAQKDPADPRRRAAPAVRASASASPGVKAPDRPAALLRKPLGATLPLAGLVRLDAGYLVAAGAGNVLSRNGSQIVAAGGLNLIGADGASLIGADGGSLVGPDGASIVAAGAGNIVAAGGLNHQERAPIDASGNLVAAGGLNLIGADGGSLIGADGASYALAQAGAATQAGAPPLAAGAQLPAAGLLVSVVRLSDGTYLPLGVDAEGHAVHAVYSNAQGGYEVWIPEAERGNVVIVASVPGSQDARLHLNRAAEPGAGGNLAVDEGASLATRYLRLSLTRKLVYCIRYPELARLMVATEAVIVGAPGPSAPTGVVGSPHWRVAEVLRRLAVYAREAGIPDDAPDAVWEEAAQRIADVAIGRIPLGELLIRSDYVTTWPATAAPKPVMEALEEVTGVMHEGAARKLQADPGFFTQAFLADTINGPVGGMTSPPIADWTGRIRKPSDVGEFLLVEFFGAVRVNASEPVRRMFRVFYEALGEAEPALGARADEAVEMGRAAGYTVLVSIAQKALGPEIGEAGEVRQPDLALEAEMRALLAEVAAHHR